VPGVHGSPSPQWIWGARNTGLQVLSGFGEQEKCTPQNPRESGNYESQLPQVLGGLENHMPQFHYHGTPKNETYTEQLGAFRNNHLPATFAELSAHIPIEKHELLRTLHCYCKSLGDYALEQEKSVESLRGQLGESVFTGHNSQHG
jgi:hypothetical protein